MIDIYIDPQSNPNLSCEDQSPNQFLDTPDILAGKYVIYNDSGNQIAATYNKWETIDPDIIDSLIYDKQDEPDKGVVVWHPTSGQKVLKESPSARPYGLYYGLYDRSFGARGLYGGVHGIYGGLYGLYGGLYGGLSGLYERIYGLYGGLYGLYSGVYGPYEGIYGIYKGIYGIYGGIYGLNGRLYGHQQSLRHQLSIPNLSYLQQRGLWQIPQQDYLQQLYLTWN